jgi:hypothetical protein
MSLRLCTRAPCTFEPLADKATLAALGVPWVKAAAVPALSGGLDDGSVRPAPSDAQAQEDHEQGGTGTEEERQVARGDARMRHMTELEWLSPTRQRCCHRRRVCGLVVTSPGRRGTADLQ